MNITSIVGIALFGTVAILLLKTYKAEEWTVLVMLGCGGVLLLICLSQVTRIQEAIQQLLDQTGMKREWFATLLKVMGVCYLCGFGSDTCRDAGQQSLAGYVELAGKIVCVGLCLPMVGTVIETIGNWMNK